MPNELHHLGRTRSARRSSYLLQTPDTFVRTQIPGSTGTSVIVHVSPEIGAAFTQYTAEFEVGGALGEAIGERFVYVLDGELTLETEVGRHTLGKDEYAFIPQGMQHRLAAARASRAAVIERSYRAIEGVSAPELLIGREAEVAGQPLMGDEALMVRGLLPDTNAFDFAVNTMTYLPGASLSLVEIHVMEHGLLMLDGGGGVEIKGRGNAEFARGNDGVQQCRVQGAQSLPGVIGPAAVQRVHPPRVQHGQ